MDPIRQQAVQLRVHFKWVWRTYHCNMDASTKYDLLQTHAEECIFPLLDALNLEVECEGDGTDEGAIKSWYLVCQRLDVQLQNWLGGAE